MCECFLACQKPNYQGVLSVLLGVTNLFLFSAIIGIAITLATYILTKIRHYDDEKKPVSDTLNASDKNE